MSGILSLVISAAFILLFLAMMELHDSSEATARSQRVLIAANTLERQVLNVETGVRGFVITGEKVFLAPWHAGIRRFPGQAAALRRLASGGSGQQEARVRRITRAADSYINDYSVPLVAIASHNLAAARNVTKLAKGKRLVDALRAQFAQLITAERRIVSGRQARATAAARNATAAASVGVAGSIALILLSGGYLARSVVRPVRQAATMARQVADGDLTVHMPEASTAEVGTLERAFNSMTASLASNREELERIAVEQAALRRVATLVARGVRPPEVFGAVATETGKVLHAACTVVARQEPGGSLTVTGSWASRDAPAPALGSRWPAGEPRRGTQEGSGGAFSGMAAWARSRGLVFSVTSPITVEGRIWGVVAAFSEHESGPDHGPDRMLQFTELAAMAIANSDSRAQLTASRARIVAAADRARRQIERNLHDGAQQRLISLALQLRTAQASVTPGQADLDEQLDHTARGLAEVVEELREIARGLHPVILEKGGLEPALRSLARRSGLPTELSAAVDGRLPERTEAAAYYVVSEALTNAAKHAPGSVVKIGVEETGAELRVTVSDDGPGGADPGRGTGLIGLIDRVEALGGRMEIVSQAGGGTSLRATIPATELKPGGASHTPPRRNGDPPRPLSRTRRQHSSIGTVIMKRVTTAPLVLAASSKSIDSSGPKKS